MAKGDKIAGGLTDNLSVSDVAKKHDIDVSYINKEFNKGIKVEFEHTNNKSTTREIALDHIY